MVVNEQPRRFLVRSRCFYSYFESQGLILHIWGCTLDLMSEERIRRDSDDSSFYEVVRGNGRPRGNIRARPRETRDRA